MIAKAAGEVGRRKGLSSEVRNQLSGLGSGVESKLKGDEQEGRWWQLATPKHRAGEQHVGLRVARKPVVETAHACSPSHCRFDAESTCWQSILRCFRVNPAGIPGDSVGAHLSCPYPSLDPASRLRCLGKEARRVP